MMTALWQRAGRTNDRALLNTHYYRLRLAAVGPEAAGLDGSQV